MNKVTIGFDAPIEDDPEWRFWVESGNEDGSAETNGVGITEKEYIKPELFMIIHSIAAKAA